MGLMKLRRESAPGGVHLNQCQGSVPKAAPPRVNSKLQPCIAFPRIATQPRMQVLPILKLRESSCVVKRGVCQVYFMRGCVPSSCKDGLVCSGKGRGRGGEGRKPLKPLNQKFNGRLPTCLECDNQVDQYSNTQIDNQLENATTRSGSFLCRSDHASISLEPLEPM